MNDTDEEFNKLTSDEEKIEIETFNLCLVMHFSIFQIASTKQH